MYLETAILELLKQMQMEDAHSAAAFGTGGLSARGWWVSKEDGDAVQLKVEMPGLGKEHVKVTLEKNVLVINGEGEKDPEDGGDAQVPVRYCRRFKLHEEVFKMDRITAVMSNGVLKVTVPKIKEDVTPGFPNETKCISYVRQDHVPHI